MRIRSRSLTASVLTTLMVMMLIPLMSGILNRFFILDLIVTLGAGESLASLLVDYTGNSVAQAVIANIPTDPIMFWILAGFILAAVCAMECLLIYNAFYSDVSEYRRLKEASR